MSSHVLSLFTGIAGVVRSLAVEVGLARPAASKLPRVDGVLSSLRRSVDELDEVRAQQAAEAQRQHQALIAAETARAAALDEANRADRVRERVLALIN